MPKIVHFEINAKDPARAIKFYQNVFGWKIDKPETMEDYWFVKAGEDSDPGINGGIQKVDKSGVGVYNIIDVNSLEETIEKIENNGGKLVSKTPVPGIGYSAYFIDSEGNRLGIIEEDESVS